MKKLQQICAVAMFTLALAATALGGHIQTPGKSEPPPPPSPAPASATTSDETPIAPKDDAAYEYQLIEDIALDLLRTMLSVF